jgi:hypothetical protein
MLLIPNVLRTVATSYAVWIGQLSGYLTLYVTWLSNQTPADQATLHAGPQLHWFPIVVSFLTIVGIPIARSIAQGSKGGS